MNTLFYSMFAWRCQNQCVWLENVINPMSAFLIIINYAYLIVIKGTKNEWITGKIRFLIAHFWWPSEKFSARFPPPRKILIFNVLIWFGFRFFAYNPLFYVSLGWYKQNRSDQIYPSVKKGFEAHSFLHYLYRKSLKFCVHSNSGSIFLFICI